MTEYKPSTLESPPKITLTPPPSKEVQGSNSKKSKTAKKPQGVPQEEVKTMKSAGYLDDTSPNPQDLPSPFMSERPRSTPLTTLFKMRLRTAKVKGKYPASDLSL